MHPRGALRGSQMRRRHVMNARPCFSAVLGQGQAQKVLLSVTGNLSRCPSDDILLGYVAPAPARAVDSYLSLYKLI